MSDYKKLYEEALDRAKENYHAECLAPTLLEYIFPEIKESNEDEGIRKELLGFIKNWKNPNNLGRLQDYPMFTKNEEQCNKYIAWLEKLGEQKHKFNIGDIISNGQAVYRVDSITKNCIGQDCYFLVNIEDEKNGTRGLMLDSHGQPHRCGEITWLCEQVDKAFEKKELKVKPKFKVGDWITIDKPCQIINISDNGNYIVRYCDDESMHVLSKNFCESYFHLWTIKDAKDGEVLVSSTNHPFIYNGKLAADAVGGYCGLDVFNIFTVEKHTKECNWTNNKDIHPATKEQRDQLFAKMKEAGYEWDSEQKQLKKIEQNFTWSIEDTFKVQRICKYLDEAKKYYDDITEVRDCIEWLKSLETLHSKENNSN